MSDGKLTSLQVHHIFPKALLRKNGFDRTEINALANFCFLTQDTNLKIGMRDPADYLPEVQSRHPGVLESQWIPTDPELWRVDRYLDFLAARRELLAASAQTFLDSLRSPEGPHDEVKLERLQVADEVVDDPRSEQVRTLISELESRGFATPVMALPRPRRYVLRSQAMPSQAVAKLRRRAAGGARRAKALSAAVREVFGAKALIQRCTLHKRRDVADHLPDSQKAWVDAKLVKAFGHPDPDTGLRNAKSLAGQLDKNYPSAAASLREGLDEMFTAARLGIDGRLAKTLTTSNPVESMISIARATNRNVTRWRDGQMVLRWTAAGMLNAERSFRRIKGYKQMPQLVDALHRHAHRNTDPDTKTVGAAA